MKVTAWFLRYSASIAFTVLVTDPMWSYAPWSLPVKLLYAIPVGILTCLLVWIAIDSLTGNPPFWTGREMQ